MQLVLVKNDTLFKLALPEKCTGQYWVGHTEPDGKRVNLVSVEGVDGSWRLKSNRAVSLVAQDGSSIREIEIEPNDFYHIMIQATGEHLLIRSEPSTEDRRTYSKWALPSSGALTIGREAASITFASEFVSSTPHATIEIEQGRMSLVDTTSRNGTFVNGRRVSRVELCPGDVIAIVGLVIVVGGGFIAINNPDGLVTVNEAVLRPLQVDTGISDADDDIEEARAAEVFSRSPRLRRDICTAEVRIDAPPQSGAGEDMPIMFMLGPAITMGMSSLFMGVFAVMNVLNSENPDITRALPTLVMSFSMLTGMILWPILSRRYDKRRKTESERIRHEKYRDYLEATAAQIESERAKQSEVLAENIVPLRLCVDRIRKRERNLWERMIVHNDFLRIRLGVGEWPLDIDIKHSERRFSLEDDVLLEDMYSIAEQPRVLSGVPVSLSLKDQPIIGLIGERAAAAELVRSIVVQMAALHSYDDLKMVFIYDSAEADLWDFVRLLPHAWNDDKTMRFVATTATDAKQLSAVLDRELIARESLTSDEELAEVSPHYVVFALNRDLSHKTELAARILRQKRCRGFSLVNVYDTLSLLPKECKAVVEVRGGESRIFNREDPAQKHVSFVPDTESVEDARELAMLLANTELDTAAQAFTLPGMLTFLELFEVGKVEHLNVLTRWKESNPVNSLETPIGIGSSGETFKLDIHERYHGPHGLIAGMTGSGKSEFIMTYILSLAVNYDPNELAFVLIDYKGGGMANAFVDLPHVAGTITNLDGAAVNRSLVSIQSELKRRQAIFNEASEKTGTSNIDIYRYQSLYREGRVQTPLPHLLIISDEFAELKTQQPEFMAQLVSAARIGRSLGVHLVLATQKPSGVVDDQIWSNSKFRVCLKVQERADSMEVIKRPDAAELSATGRFYLQVGFNELFELGQSAWAGAPYYPADRVEKAYDNSVEAVNNLGQPVRRYALDRRKKMFGNPAKQLDEITTHIARLAEEEGVRANPLWLEPIPADIYLDELQKKYATRLGSRTGIQPVVGEHDDPANQSQNVLTLPLSSEGNVVVYGSAGAGKTSFVLTLAASLMETYTPEQVALYILDFGAETLRAVREAPHVGDVVLSHEDEKIENLFKMLLAEVDRRKKLLSESGGDLSTYNAQSAHPLESIVVVIHNYSAFSEMYDGKEEVVSYLSREGTKYGVYFVLTASSSSAVRYRILQNFKQLLVLQLNDQTEYAGILGNTGGVVPSAIKGRGIVKMGGGVYEFQSARPNGGRDNDFAYIRERSAELADSWTGARARRIPVLPEVVDPQYLRDEILRAPWADIPVGIDRSSLDVVSFDFSSQFVSVVMSQDNEDMAFIQALVQVFGSQSGGRTIVIDSSESLVHEQSRGYDLRVGRDASNAAVAELFEEMVRRNNTAKEAMQKGQEPPVEERLLVVVPWFTGLLNVVTDDNREKLVAIFQKCDESLGAKFVLSDSASGFSTLSYESWLKPHLSSNTGIWIGDGFTDQYVLQATKTGSDLYQSIGSRFGWILASGKTRLVKLMRSALYGSGEFDE